MGTYIKWHRQILRNPVFKYDQTAWHIFETLALTVDYKTGSWNGGRKVLARLCDIPEMTVYKALKRLENAKMVTLVSNKRFTTISICNWSHYQADGNTSGNTSGNTFGNTIKRNKEIKNNNYSEIEPSKTKPDDLLALVNRITSHNFRVLPERGVKKTLDAFTLDEIETALTNLVNDEWHSDKIAGLKIDYLIRATTIDKFLHKKTKRYWNPNDSKEDE